MPIGVEISMEKSRIRPLPTMALRKPPPSEPGAGVSWVNISQFKAAKPFEKSVHKIHNSAISPRLIATMDILMPMRLIQMRRVYSFIMRALQTFGAHAAADQPARNGQHDKSDDKQHQTQREQRSNLQAGRSLAELICQWRRDRGPGGKQAAIDTVGVADHERDRHRFAQRTAQSQHDAANDAHTGIRQYAVAHDFPDGTAAAVGGFLQYVRHGLEHNPHTRRNKGNDHQGQHDAGSEDAAPDGRAREPAADDRNVV